MIDYSEVREAVHQWCSPRVVGEYVVVPTYLTYPSNSLAQVYVRGDRGIFFVGDGGGAVDTLMGAGARTGAPQKLLNEFLKSRDAKVSPEGWIYQNAVTLERLTDAISCVSEISVEAARFMLRRYKPEPVMDFRRDLDVALRQTFLSKLHKRGHVTGASNKTHTFDYLINANDNIIILDAVVRDSSSVNAAVVAHMDVRATNRPEVRQFIVYDDEDDWSAADIALLTIGAPTIAYSHFPKTVLARYG